jgi:hypothetical protein
MSTTLNTALSDVPAVPEGYVLMTEDVLKTAGARFDPKWCGFLRSREKGNGNRYKTMCSYCNQLMQGKPDVLPGHVVACKIMVQMKDLPTVLVN